MYVASCEVYHLFKAPRHAQYVTNMPQPPRYNPSDGIAMDFVTDLMESTQSKYNRILIKVYRLTWMAIYQFCPKDIDSAELACIILDREV
jgi:hypothetical protein